MTLAKILAVSLLLILVSGFATAEDKTVSFKLSHDAYIGSTRLSAGPYRLSQLGGSNIALIQSESGDRALFQPATSREYATCDKDLVTLRPVGADWSVSSVCFAMSGVTLNFPATPVEVTKPASSANLAESK